MFKVLNLIYFEENGLKKFGWKQNDVSSEIEAASLINSDYVIKVEKDKVFTYTSIEELRSFIKMSFGLSYFDIIKKWGDNVPLFEIECEKNNIGYIKEDGEYLMTLCKIIEEHLENKELKIKKEINNKTISIL